MKHIKLATFLVAAMYSAAFSTTVTAAECPSSKAIQMALDNSQMNPEGNGQYDRYKFFLTHNFDTRSACVLRISLYAEDKKDAVKALQQALPSLRNPKMIDPEDSGSKDWICVYDIDQPSDGQRHDLSVIVKI
jgi:hypothetical protein